MDKGIEKLESVIGRKFVRDFIRYGDLVYMVVPESKNPITEEGEFMIVESWNLINKLEQILENLEVEKNLWELIDWGFSDEYTICSGCGNLIKTSPSSYTWKANYWMDRGGIYCESCVRDIPSQYIDSLTNSPRKANTILKPEELKNQGFEKYNGEFVTGFHRGQTDSPEEVFEELKTNFEEVLFSISCNSQFSTSWEVFVRGDLEKTEAKNQLSQISQSDSI